jgi:hypothetical protein
MRVSTMKIEGSAATSDAKIDWRASPLSPWVGRQSNFVSTK